MISFAFSPEREDFRAELRRFARTELAPRYVERAGQAAFPWDAHRRLADLGVLGIGVIHGNLGYSTDMPLQQRYRDVMSYLIGDGTAAIQKRIIATSLLGKVAIL